MIEHTTVPANGIRFHVAQSGPPNAPLLLCLHGFPECWYSWRHLLESFSDRFRVVAPDLRGFGDSEKPATGYDVDTLAADVRGLVRALGRDQCHLVGHDWGGAVAYYAAMRAPEVVERLVVMNCPHPNALARALLTSPRQVARFWYFFLFQIPWLPERYLLRQNARAVAGGFKHYAARPDAISREDRQVYRREIQKPGAIAGGLAYYRSAFRGMFRGAGWRTPTARKIAAPTLILWGLQDRALGVELTYGMEQYFSGPYSIEYFRDVGHWTQQEAPREVYRAMSSFLANSV